MTDLSPKKPASQPLSKSSGVSPKAVAIGVILCAAAALAGALTGQYAFGLHPCELCVYQRIPFVILIFLGILALVWRTARVQLLALSALLFLINAGIALFHSGVERKWWAGLSGCSTPDMSGSIDDLMQRIQQTSVVRCDEIPWSFLGLSMANYNVAYCAVAGLALLACLAKLRR